MSRPLLKFSGGSVHDYATFSTAGFSQLTNHGTPNRSTSLPNRSAQKVSAMGKRAFAKNRKPNHRERRNECGN